MAKSDAYKEPDAEVNLTDVFKCYTQFLISQAITEKQGDKIVDIGSLTLCYRRFLKPPPSDKIAGHLSFIDLMGFQHKDCSTCVRELTSFKKSIKIFWEIKDEKTKEVIRPAMTQMTKNEAREFISRQVRLGCVDFCHNSGFHTDKEPLPVPGVPKFGEEPYNPNEFIEPCGF